VRVALYAASLEADPAFREEMADLHDKLDADWQPEGVDGGVLARYLAAERRGEAPSEYLTGATSK
jgi:hypothetical protein